VHDTHLVDQIRIVAEMDVARAALRAGMVGEQLGFDAAACAMLATAVSELARNIIKYAGKGEVRLTRLEGSRPGVEVIAIDQGPGISDTAAALTDHYSSSGTLGLGLPGVRRLMDEFELESEAGKGTRVVARKWRPRLTTTRG